MFKNIKLFAALTVVASLVIAPLSTGAIAGPKANDDSVWTPACRETLIIKPLKNDVGEDIRVTSITDPEVGQAEIRGDDKIAYKNCVAEGFDNFTYTITDRHGATDTAKIRVLVMTPFVETKIVDPTCKRGESGFRINYVKGPYDYEIELTLYKGHFPNEELLETRTLKIGESTKFEIVDYMGSSNSEMFMVYGKIKGHEKVIIVGFEFICPNK